MKNKRIEILVIAILIIMQSIIYVIVGQQKAYLHIDEAYSFGLTHYAKIEIQDNEDFYNNWHNNKYYEDYLAVSKTEIGNYKPVYENQKNDVHPPLYYLLLRFAMELTPEHFSKWTGIALNIVIYAFITIFMYLILKKLFKEEKYSNEKSAILAFMSSIILASLSNAIYIRMYALSTLNILITVFLHIKLLESEKINPKLLICIGLSVLAGVLTHYYYLFYLFILYLIFVIKYIKEKKLKILMYYTLTMIISGVLSLIIFPYSIQHMFFGYRGQGVISNLKNISEILPSIFSQIYIINYYVFNNLLIIVVAGIVGILIYNRIRKKENLKNSKEKREILKIIYVPTIFFLLITAIASPWKVLRYVVPVCGLVFVIGIYYLYKLLKTIFKEKTSNIIICAFFCMILISPFIFDLKPELLYSDNKDIVQKLGEELNLPTIYLYNSQNGGFLGDILLFTKINESYIAKDIENIENDLPQILGNKDISNGIIVFINYEQDRENIINKVKETLNFAECQHLKRLTSCDVYYMNLNEIN